MLDSYPPKEVAEKFFPLDMSRPEKEALQFHELAARMDRIRAVARAESSGISEMAQLASGAEKITERILKDLLKGNISGYYYLESIGDTELASTRGYVVLLREVHHVESTIIRQIAAGIDRQTWDDDKSTRVPNFTVFDFALPTARLTSPHIEHMLQVFGMLFMRIGVPDPDASLLPKLRGVFTGE